MSQYRFKNQFVLGFMLLLCVPVCFAQARKNQTLRKSIDSLNRLAFDHPLDVLKSADSFIVAALKHNQTIEYALLLQVKGVAETSLGNNTEALKFHMDSYHIFDSIANNKGKIFALINIATVHMNMEDFDKGIDYLNKALSITLPEDTNSLKTIYVNLGVCSQSVGRQKKAIGYFLKAIPFMEKLKDYNGLAVNYHNLAESYNLQSDAETALKYELKALSYQQKSGSESSLAMISLSLGSLYSQDKNFRKAKQYLEIGGKAAFGLDSPYYKDTYYQLMSEYYKLSGDYRNSGIFLEKLLALRDSINSEEKTEINTEMEARFQNSLKSKEIELLKIQKKLDDSRIDSNRFWRMVFLVVSILCLVIIFILYRNYKLKQKANKMLDNEKTVLEKQNLQLENENILVQFETLKNQVSPHFLFNSLNALASLIKTDSDKALEFTNVFSRIFRNTLELKNKHLITLSEELQHVNSYIYLQKMRFGDNLLTDIHIASEKMEYYLPPFSLQMVLENAVKHNVITTEHPLHIAITVDGDFLVVTNNLQSRRFVEDSTGTGLKNIRSRYKYVTDAVPVFEVKNNEYRAMLPLIKEE